MKIRKKVFKLELEIENNNEYQQIQIFSLYIDFWSMNFLSLSVPEMIWLVKENKFSSWRLILNFISNKHIFIIKHTWEKQKDKNDWLKVEVNILLIRLNK
jgi:hypothetical protein